MASAWDSTWDVIVIGAGISGMTAAAALAKKGRRVLVIEQYKRAGGLTQTFRRRDWTFATGVHYVSGAADVKSILGGSFRRLMAWLTDDKFRFARLGDAYDIVRTPGFEFAISSPEESYRQALIARFPDEKDGIEAWFAEMARARGAGVAQLMKRCMPPLIAWGVSLFKGKEISYFARRTVHEALHSIRNPELRAVLGARGGDYGGYPSTAPVLSHAIVTGSYNAGSFFPEGGPEEFANHLIPVVRAAGGELVCNARVTAIQRDDKGRVAGVSFAKGREVHQVRAPYVISTMGLFNTQDCLDDAVAADWRADNGDLQAGVSCLSLYLGFKGDIAAAGATDANYWIYDSTDLDRHWTSPLTEDAPALFVSFPSMKDPAHPGLPTGEVLAHCDATLFAPWLDLPSFKRPPEYYDLKARLEERLLAQFKRHFPALGEMIAFHEMATPATQHHYVRTPMGSLYGLAPSTGNALSPALQARTPVKGLLIAGQDVSGAGVQAASLSGMFAAGAIDSSLLNRTR